MTCRVRRLVPLAVAVLIVSACGNGSGSGVGSSSMTLYTCASANVEQAVVSAFERAHHGAKVNVFRAPTGQLNARVAADVRSGGIEADVIWACDPLTMHGYDAQGLLRAWTPPNASAIPSADRTPHFVGVDLLYMVLVVHKGIAAPTTWAELAGSRFRGKVALPSPSFAASALGLLGYFASAPGYGIDYYRKLKDNGAVQVNAPADTLDGVAQGTYSAGVTLANAGYTAQEKGSPIQVAWPRPGGVAIYAPIGLTTKRNHSPLADTFAAFAASRDGQKLMAEQGTYVTIGGLGGPPIPPASPTAAPDWPSLFSTYKSVLARYSAIFS
ncbi:MAG: extracellular solute-binding protein [Jatrophihabitantaceae bacterium]